jgi:PAS domain S-box-containing protein
MISILRQFNSKAGRKKTQKLVIQNEEKFHSLIQYLSEIIWIIDKNTTIQYESPASCQILGYEPGYLIGKSGLKLIHPDDLSDVKLELENVFTNKNDHLPTEFRVKHAKGHWISLDVIANNMLDHPAIKGVIINARDITERRRVEKALSISETKFRNIFNNSSDSIVIMKKDFSLLEVNDIFLQTTGYSQEEVKKIKLTQILADNYLPLFVDKMNKTFTSDSLSVIECEIITKNKKVFPVEIKSKRIEFEGEHAVISVILDIAERRQLENKILEAIIMTEEREREKFARNLHDELGPLLSSIKMYINSLSSEIDKVKHDFITAQLKKIIDDVIQSTKDLSNDLSSHILTNYGLLAALESFINQLKPYISIILDSNLKDNRLPISYELSVYRIIKELINNTLKHSKATKADIKLNFVLNTIHLDYMDNGIGFIKDWEKNFESKGMGISNIYSRCRSINATSKFFNNAPNGMSFMMECRLE